MLTLLAKKYDQSYIPKNNQIKSKVKPERLRIYAVQEIVHTRLQCRSNATQKDAQYPSDLGQIVGLFGRWPPLPTVELEI